MAGGNLGDAVQAKLRGNILSFEVNASVTAVEGHIYRGSPVAVRKTSSGTITEGYASNPSDAIDVNWAFVGIAEEECDLTAVGASNGDKRIKVRRHGIFRMKVNSGAAALSHVGKMAFLKTQHTYNTTFEIDLAGLCTYTIAIGLIVGYIDADYVFVDITPAPWASLVLTTHENLMASNSGGEGASLVGAEVAGGVTKFSGSDVQAILAELGVNIASAQVIIPIPLNAWHLENGAPITGTPSGSAPGFQQDNNEELVISWPTDANPGEIITNIMIPPDLDATEDFILHILAFGCAADHPTFTVQAFSPVMGAAINSDDDFGVTSSELTAGATLKELTSVMLASAIAAAPGVITLIINPTDGELAANSLLLYGTWIEYTRKILTS